MSGLSAPPSSSASPSSAPPPSSPPCSSTTPSTPSLEPRPSHIPKAGLGLFLASGRILRGDVVALYTGEVKTTQQVFQQRRDNKADDGGYLMRVGFAPGSGEGEQGIVWVDAQADSSVLARYINDARLPLAYNVEFRKRPEHRDAEVVALRDIVEGEEMFVDYGVAYWRGVTYEASKMKALQLGELYSKLVAGGASLAFDAQCQSVLEMYERAVQRRVEEMGK
ncbi:hypothetical protein TeGR_g7649 [Tetraparma gracilis]|uniref:SET domain-containing protein n=1 Tax=Tetraparma gracilis TaxID=2962635 RepID=A0ABQ6MYP3_9STRA|nr:hypothetical protein TeGR_g7649 [Tetraparma gracilis]